MWPTILVSEVQLGEAGEHTLITVRTFDFTIVARLGAVFAEMTLFLAVPTCNSIWVTGFVTFLADMTFLATVAAIVPPTGRTVLRKMSHCKLSE